jgi:hypothetical protein
MVVQCLRAGGAQRAQGVRWEPPTREAIRCPAAVPQREPSVKLEFEKRESVPQNTLKKVRVHKTMPPAKILSDTTNKS